VTAKVQTTHADIYVHKEQSAKLLCVCVCVCVMLAWRGWGRD